jgi:hypothetical protein
MWAEEGWDSGRGADVHESWEDSERMILIRVPQLYVGGKFSIGIGVSEFHHEKSPSASIHWLV